VYSRLDRVAGLLNLTLAVGRRFADYATLIVT
jgi:hypothetical protein